MKPLQRRAALAAMLIVAESLCGVDAGAQQVLSEPPAPIKGNIEKASKTLHRTLLNRCKRMTV